MHIILSPTKNMKMIQTPYKAKTLPLLADSSLPLIQYLQGLEPYQLASLMKINDGQSLEVWKMYQDLAKGHYNKEKTPAILAYEGLVFKYLNQKEWSRHSLEYANEHLSILSGLWGLVRPFDKIGQYRLEMQTKLSLEGNNLYDYWGDQIYEALCKRIQKGEYILNLASKEYSQCILKYVDKGRVVDVEFVVYRQGKYKTLATFAKMARGLMARYVIENRISQPEKLQDFCELDYHYEERLSSSQCFVFVKEE